MSEPGREPPTQDELMSRLQDLKTKAEALQAQARQQQGGLKWGRIAMLFGVPLLAAIATYVATGSILYTLVAFVGAFVAMVWLALKLFPNTGVKLGSRAWEAGMTAELLVRVIAERTAQRVAAPNDHARGKLDREIEFLTKQLDENRMVAMSGDPSPGKGYVGFEPYNGN